MTTKPARFKREATKVIRVPLSLVDTVTDLITALRDEQAVKEQEYNAKAQVVRDLADKERRANYYKNRVGDSKVQRRVQIAPPEQAVVVSDETPKTPKKSKKSKADSKAKGKKMKTPRVQIAPVEVAA